MKYEKVIPGASRIISSLSDLGYDLETAIADLVDNSISENSGLIEIDINYDKKKKPFIYILDDGDGMDKSQLLNAMKFGSDKDYDDKALGKYGLGLKTASLSQCRRMLVITKPKKTRGSRSGTIIACWDMELIEKKNEWLMINYSTSDLDPHENEILKKIEEKGAGTAIIWSNLREHLSPLSENSEKDKLKIIPEQLDKIQNHIAMVFHRFLSGDAHSKKVKIKVSGENVEAWDPFCKNEDNCKSLDPKSYKIKSENKTNIVKVKPFIIPNEEDFSSPAAWKKAKGTKGLNRHQGFYFYRNDRLLNCGGWAGIRTLDEHTKLVRVSIDFDKTLDNNFSINITKMLAKIPPEIFDDLDIDSKKWVSEGNAYYRKKAKKNIKKDNKKPERTKIISEQRFGRIVLTTSTSSNKDVFISKNKDADKIKILIPIEHSHYEIMKKFSKFEDADKLAVIEFLYLEQLSLGKISIKDIPLEFLRKKIREII